MPAHPKTTGFPPLRLAAALAWFSISALAGCAAPPPTKPGTHLQLQTITHDGQTAYSYRAVPN